MRCRVLRRELQWRVDQAGKHGIELSVEGHIGSIVDTPDKLMQLVDRTPGLKLNAGLWPLHLCRHP